MKLLTVNQIRFLGMRWSKATLPVLVLFGFTIIFAGCGPSLHPISGTDQEPAGKQKGASETNCPEEAAKESPLDEAIRKSDEAAKADATNPQDESKPDTIVPPHDELVPFIEPDWIRLHPQHQVWLDMKNKQVIVAARVCFRDGPLEMFACPQMTKEHESVVSTFSNAEIIHTGLLATGAVPGKPVSWDPDFVAPSGPVVTVTAAWSEAGKRVEQSAQSMILDARTGKPMDFVFVYCGSKVWSDPEYPQYREFQADQGDLICVSNFSSALIDVGTESSQAKGGLMFHANPEMIPVLGKPVLVFLKPEIKVQEGETKSPSSPGDKGQTGNRDK